MLHPREVEEERGIRESRSGLLGTDVDMRRAGGDDKAAGSREAREKRTHCRRASAGVPALYRRWLSVGKGVCVTGSGAGMKGPWRCDCRDQRYEEDNTARDNCSDQYHVSIFFVWAEGKL